ncbi:MAG: phosphatase PAP2 family protein [Clostridia bacterium]|nr:phosphatase PAP2 family protein [Clostridia bacterium]
MEVIKFLQQFSNPILDRIFILFTMLGEDTFFIIVITFTFWCVNKRFAYKLAFAFMMNGAINSSIKELLAVQRPIGQPGIFSLWTETATGYSFPSGHTESAASFWTSVMLEVRKKGVYIAGAIAITLVALSRVYLGVHWPQDVVAGAVFGIVIVIISNRIFELHEKSKRKHMVLLLMIPVLAGMLFFSSADYYKAAGVVCSFILGYVADLYFIRYETRATFIRQILKFVIGISVIVCIKSGVKALLPDWLICNFLRYFLMGLWVTVLAPILFKYMLRTNLSGGNKSVGSIE